MEQLSERLIDTAEILKNLPAVLDLADDRELGMLARIFAAYVKFEGPKEYWYNPGYLEDVLVSTMVEEARRGGCDWDEHRRLTDIENPRCMIVDSAVTFAQRVASEDEHRFLRDVISLVSFGEKVPGEEEKKRFTVREAFEHEIAKLQRKQKEEGSRAPLEIQRPAAKRKRRKAA